MQSIPFDPSSRWNDGKQPRPVAVSTNTRRAMMRTLILAGAVVMAPAVTWAQSPQLENTCQIAARNFLLTDRLNVGVIQSFPELKPPGVRLTYSIRPGTAKSDMSDSFECEFDQTNPPYHLTRFCVSDICYSGNDTNADRKRRFDEMRILLDRANK